MVLSGVQFHPDQNPGSFSKLVHGMITGAHIVICQSIILLKLQIIIDLYHCRNQLNNLL